MFVDYENQFSDAQAVTASAASTNVVDMLKKKRGAGAKPLKIQCSVQTQLASAGGTATLTVSVQSANVEAFGTKTTHFSTAAIAEASLVAGYDFNLPPLPDDIGRYVRLYFTVANENFTSGNIDGALVLDKQSNNYEFIAAQQ